MHIVHNTSSPLLAISLRNALGNNDTAHNRLLIISLNFISIFVSDLPIIAEDNQSPGGSYENLRQIVQAVVQEVLRLPEFYSQKDAGTIATVSHAYDSNSNQAATPFDPKKYEDLLATAVINKVSRRSPYAPIRFEYFVWTLIGARDNFRRNSFCGRFTTWRVRLSIIMCLSTRDLTQSSR